VRLGEGGQNLAEDHGAGRVANQLEQLALALRFHRHQAHRAIEHLAAIAQQKEQQEQHHEEVDDRAEGAEHEVAASGRQRLQQHLSAADQPAFDLFGRGGEVVAQPLGKAADEGVLLQLREQTGVEAQRMLLQARGQIRDLVRECRAKAEQRAREQDRHHHGDDPRRQVGASLQLAHQPALHRRQQESEADTPGQRAPEGRKYPVQGEGAEGRDDDHEVLGVDIQVHSLRNVGPVYGGIIRAACA
jgi:hypothetical protein